MLDTDNIFYADNVRGMITSASVTNAYNEMIWLKSKLKKRTNTKS